MERPKAFILRKTKRSYTVRCPFCLSQHQHGIVGDMTDRLSHCSTEAFLSKREKHNLLISSHTYDSVKTYDLEWPPENYVDTYYLKRFLDYGQ